MKRIRLTVAYDGTNYCGFQLQNNGPTIEGELHTALTAILGHDVKLISASRTDAGVHSMGNVAVFDTDSRIPAEKFAYALNSHLPADIVVRKTDEVSADWHPRRQSSRKTYEYRILNAEFPDPLRRLDHYHYHHPLNLTAMQRAAKCLEGTHDFASFASAHRTVETTVRTLYALSVIQTDDVITIRACGSGFLYNMVRIIAGTLILAGAGCLDPDAIPGILTARDRAAAGPTAPAHGLTMIGIEYEE